MAGRRPADGAGSGVTLAAQGGVSAGAPGISPLWDGTRPTTGTGWTTITIRRPGLAGASPARSALTLRLVLAAFGLLFCGVAAVLAARADRPGFAVAFGALAVAALIDLAVVARRKARGEPG